MSPLQAEQVIALLTEIRDLLTFADEPEPVEEDESGKCLHPDYVRVDMGRGEWICRRCRYQFSGVDHAQAPV